MQAEGEIVQLSTERVAPPKDFRIFFEEEHGRLFKTLYFVTGNRTDAADLMQEAFAKLWERWDTIDRIDDPTAYLFKVALNGNRMRLRAARRAAKRSIPLGIVRDPFDEVDIREDVLRMLRDLAPDRRTVPGSERLARPTVPRVLLGRRGAPALARRNNDRVLRRQLSRAYGPCRRHERADPHRSRQHELGGRGEPHRVVARRFADRLPVQRRHLRDERRRVGPARDHARDPRVGLLLPGLVGGGDDRDVGSPGCRPGRWSDRLRDLHGPRDRRARHATDPQRRVEHRAVVVAGWEPTRVLERRHALGHAGGWQRQASGGHGSRWP